DPVNPGRDASPNHNDGKLVGNARALPSTAAAKVTQGVAGPFGDKSTRVLVLDEKGSFVELPPGIFKQQSEGTVEAWVRLRSLQRHYQRVITVDSAKAGEMAQNPHFALMTDAGTGNLWFLIVDPKTGWQKVTANNALKVGAWTHLAAVAGTAGMHLYVNGIEAGTHPYTDGFKYIGDQAAARLGQMTGGGSDCTPFDGDLAEVRLWNVARTPEQIRE